MTTQSGVSVLIFLGALVAAVNGLEPLAKFPAEDCVNPPMKKFGHECCRLPKERIWGDLRGSLRMCLRKLRENVKAESQFMQQEAEEGEPEMVTPETGSSTGDPSESASAPGMSYPSTTPRDPHGSRRPHWRRPHQLHPRLNDSCFMECVFEDQGFLMNKMVNKEALLTRLRLTLGRNEPWHAAAVAALEKCFLGLQVPATGTCPSGSEEIFRCTLKQLFFNCPSWLQTDYCSSLKEFYQKCPNGPPPQVPDTHTSPPPEEDMEGSVTTENQKDAPEQ